MASCAGIVAILGFAEHDDNRANAFDVHAARWIQADLPQPAVAVASWASSVAVMAAVVVLTVAAAARNRRWDVVALALLAPVLATLLTEQLLKPLVHHTTYWVPPGAQPSLTFPSGHETFLTSIAVVLGLVLLSGGVSVAATLAGSALLSIYVALGAIGLVARHLHSATDTIGAVGVALAVTLLVAMAVDRAAASVAPRRRELVS